MNYDGDDELERMRLRRQLRREARQDREETENRSFGRSSYNAEEGRSMRNREDRRFGREPEESKRRYGTGDHREWGYAEDAPRLRTDGYRRREEAGSRQREGSRTGSFREEYGHREDDGIDIAFSGRSTRTGSSSRERGQERRNNARDERPGRTRTGQERSAKGENSSGSPSFRSGYSGPKNGSGGRGTRGGRGGKKGGFSAMDRRKKILLIAGGVILALVLFVVGAFAYVNHAIFGRMQKVDFDEKKVENVNLSDDQLAQMKGYWTVACFGVDSRMENGKMNVGKGTNADVNMICSVNLESGEIKLVSVFRDTYLNISDKNTYNKINAAYALGGPEQAVAALNKNLDLNITQYATFNWKAVADGINILGGVDIELSESERSWINAYITETVKETGIGSHQIEKAGLVHMDGVQAVAYGRIRYGDTDYARTERQRIVLQAAFDKAKTADWATINNVIQTVMPQLATNIDMADLIPLARNLNKFHIGDTKGFPMARGEANIGKHGDCVIPQTLESNVVELHQFLFGTEAYEPSSNVKNYSAHISETSGMYKEGKSIDHVPVDQGLNASSYIKAKQKRAAEKAAAEQKAKEEAEAAKNEAEETKEELAEETEEETKDYFGDWNEEDWDEEDWDEFWGGGNWYDDWGDEGIGNDSGATGPGAEANGPGSESENSKPGNSKPGNSAQEETGSGTGKPGHTGETSSDGPSGGSQAGPSGGAKDNDSQKTPVSPISEEGAPGNENAGSQGAAGSAPGSSTGSPSGNAGGSGETAIPDPPEQEAAGPGDAGPAGPGA